MRRMSLQVVLRLEGGSVHRVGAGLPAPQRRNGGMGLRIMAHRAMVIRGSFDVRARPEGGTRVICEAPNP